MLARVLVHALLAVEHKEEHPEGVERRHEYAHQHRVVGKRGARQVGCTHGFNNRILGEKAGKAGKPDERQGADQSCPVGNGHVLAQSAHVAHVLLVMQRDDHRARREKQQCLEKGVRHQVKDARRIGGSPKRDGHVPELGERRIGNDAFDVVLNDTEQPHEEGRDGSNDQNQR